MNASFLKRTCFIFLLILFTTKGNAQSALYPHEFDLEEVTLLDGPFKKAMLLNDSILLAYDVDRLLQPFQKQAGITQTGAAFTNWCGDIGSGLDGHVGGHYLSALAMHYAASRDEAVKVQLKARFDYMLAQLKLCQDAITDTTNVMYGYVGGVPSSTTVWTNLYNLNLTYYTSSWVPWYNIHKIYAGLRDAWLYMDSEDARTMFLKLCNWGIRITSKLTEAQMQTMLDKEHGGMNEVYADAFQMTGDSTYLVAAKRFSHKVLVNYMKSNTTTYLDGKHANTQIPKVIGFDRIAQLDPTATDYATASINFWNNVVGNRTLALGGNSVSEYFLSTDNCYKYTTEREGPESCNTYNMLKLTENLFSTTPKAVYADFFEKALYNHILSTQHPEHGGYVYFTSARPQHYRVYSQVNQAMWCCVGSGMENHGKYGQFIYTRNGSDSLYVNLFIASQLNWKEHGAVITQETRFPYEQGTKLTISLPEGQTETFSLFIRHPEWVADSSFVVAVNGVPDTTVTVSQSYLEINRAWKNGDSVTIQLPMKIGYEVLPNYTNYIALTYGPILLGAKTNTENLVGLLAGEGRMEHVASGAYQTLTSAPILIGTRTSLPDSVEMVSADSLTFAVNGFYNNQKFNSLRLQPFYTIHDARYMMYWWQLTQDQYETIREEVEEEEAKLQELDNRTIDYVKPGEQQSETDHFMTGEQTADSIYSDEKYREATNGGWFGYRLSTKGYTDSVSLMVRYYGYETGSRTFHIVIDGDTLIAVNIANKWKTSAFLNVEYPIPSDMLSGKNTIEVIFDALSGHTAGGIYYVRLLNGRRVEPILPYTFVATDWGICDASRAPASAFSYDAVNNTFTITKSGTNNIAFKMIQTKTDVYSISNDKTYFLIKGKNLRTGSGYSYIWWFNGFNNGSSNAPTYSVTGKEYVYLLWQIPGVTNLCTNMDYTSSMITITNNGTSFINAIGLTTSAANYASTISDINFYSAEEAAQLYPEVASTLGVTALLSESVYSKALTVFVGDCGQLILTAHQKQTVSVHDLLGRSVTSVNLEEGECKQLTLRAGFYLVNGRKIVIN